MIDNVKVPFGSHSQCTVIHSETGKNWVSCFCEKYSTARFWEGPSPLETLLMDWLDLIC